VRWPEVLYAGLMEYDGDQHIPSRYLVEPPAIDRTLGEYLCVNGITQLAVAETQKYGHVTYFWNGNCSGLYDPALGRYVEADPATVVTDTYRAIARRSKFETQIEVESDRVPFEERPWMKAGEVTDVVLDGLSSGDYRFIRVNYANGDMVGHTGDLAATMAAVAAVDLSLGRLLKAIAKLDGVALITADHGNADEMYMIDKKTGEFVRQESGGFKAKTSHTLNPVPLYLFDPRGKGELAFRPPEADFGLANVAATVLNLLGFAAPEDYRPSLLRG
jgi:2,3-bisphosphoglycerate-independent phosphoglycerate mutase